MDKNVNALMNEATYEQLRQAAHETRRSMSEIIREALTLWFGQHDSVRAEDDPEVARICRNMDLFAGPLPADPFAAEA